MTLKRYGRSFCEQRALIMSRQWVLSGGAQCWMCRLSGITNLHLGSHRNQKTGLTSSVPVVNWYCPEIVAAIVMVQLVMGFGKA